MKSSRKEHDSTTGPPVVFYRVSAHQLVVLRPGENVKKVIFLEEDQESTG
jgi:hypothetical protein